MDVPVSMTPTEAAIMDQRIEHLSKEVYVLFFPLLHVQKACTDWFPSSSAKSFTPDRMPTGVRDCGTLIVYSY